MNMSAFWSKFALTTTLVHLLALGNLFAANSVSAFTITYGDSNTTDGNLGFESGNFDNSSSQSVWDTIGDTKVETTFKTIAPNTGNYQAVITNACPSGPTSGECVGTPGISTTKNNDTPTAPGTYNVSGSSEPVSASVEIATLQTFLGLPAEALQVPRENGTITGTRTPKEGSAITQTFTTDGDFKLSFNWNYLTNDGSDSRLGDGDFGFVTIYNNSSPQNTRGIIILDDSTGGFPTTLDSNSFATSGTYQQYTFSETYTAGTYTIGFGVVDVDGVDRSSALLVDNFNVKEIPFEFSPGFGLFLMGGCFGIDYFRRRQSS